MSGNEYYSVTKSGGKVAVVREISVKAREEVVIVGLPFCFAVAWQADIQQYTGSVGSRFS